MDSFILERRAYERIDQLCSEAEKAFFPKYHGAVENFENFHGVEHAIGLELLRPSLRSRCVTSNSVPPYLQAELQLLRNDLETLENDDEDGNTPDLSQLRAIWCIGSSLPMESEKDSVCKKRRLSSLERKWCESLFIDRLK